jgi:signal transduction histidine kinase
MNELVSDLLDLGRITAGLDTVTTPVNMLDLVEVVLESLSGQLEEKNHRVNLNMPDSAIIKGDEARLNQVLLNLVGNANKYTPERGLVSITLTISKAESLNGSFSTLQDVPSRLEQESLLVFRVQDNGLGIPSADLPQVFDRFFRVQSEETTKIRGTGLGLAIAKSIIEAHDGRIWVESEEGQGSTFAFYLPRSKGTA